MVPIKAQRRHVLNIAISENWEGSMEVAFELSLAGWGGF